MQGLILLPSFERKQEQIKVTVLHLSFAPVKEQEMFLDLHSKYKYLNFKLHSPPEKLFCSVFLYQKTPYLIANVNILQRNTSANIGKITVPYALLSYVNLKIVVV